MKYFIRVICFFIYVNFQAQYKVDYIFTKDSNSFYKSKSEKSFTALKVKESVKTDTVILPGSKKISPLYTKAKLELEKAKSNLIKAGSKNIEIKKQNAEIKSIKKNINSFLASEDNYDVKKKFLMLAQKTSEKHHLNYNIYADNNINSKFKTKFFILSRKKLDLKIYLRRLLPQIKIETKKAISLETINNDIKIAEKRLVNTKKYIVTEEKVKLNKTSNYKLGSFTFKPEIKLIGKYTDLGEYYVVKNSSEYTGNTLISEKEALNKNLTFNNFMLSEKFILVRNNDNKSLYLLSQDYVKEASHIKLNPMEINQKKNLTHASN